MDERGVRAAVFLFPGDDDGERRIDRALAVRSGGLGLARMPAAVVGVSRGFDLRDRHADPVRAIADGAGDHLDEDVLEKANPLAIDDSAVREEYRRRAAMRVGRRDREGTRRELMRARSRHAYAIDERLPEGQHIHRYPDDPGLPVADTGCAREERIALTGARVFAFEKTS